MDQGGQNLTDAFRCALGGIVEAFRTQRNMRIHSVFAILALLLCAILRCTAVEWGLVIAFIVLVIAAEIINSAIENIVDLISPKYHELAGRAKDMAAGAVLLISVGSVVAGLIIYICAFLRLID